MKIDVVNLDHVFEDAVSLCQIFTGVEPDIFENHKSYEST